jgi:hypothetical protein
MAILKTLTLSQISPTRWLLLFFAILGGFRIAWLGSGACAMGDEFRYWYSAQMLLAASKFDLVGTLSPMFDTAGRPGLAIVQLPPILLQSIVFKITGLDPRSVESLWIPQIWNVGITLLGAWFFFKNSVRTFSFSEKNSAWMTVIFCLLTSSNFYVRHLLPYDVALCFFLFVLLKISKKINPIWIGFLTAFGYSIYPGYWPIGFAIFVVFFTYNTLIFSKIHIQNLFKKLHLKRAFSFIFGFILLILFYEILARISGKSFIENSLHGGTEFLHFLQLPFDGSVGFLLDYLWTVEGFGGVILIFFSMLFLISISSLWFAQKKYHHKITASTDLFPYLEKVSAIEIFVFSLLVAFLLQAVLGYLTGMKIFYGRLFKQFMPAIIWMSGAAFFIMFDDKEPISRFLSFNKIIKVGVLTVFLSHFAAFHVNYSKLGYPRDVLNDFGFVQKTDGLEYDIRTKAPPDDQLRRVCEFEPPSYFTMPPVGSKKYEPLDSTLISNLFFVNFNSLPVPSRGEFHAFVPEKTGDWWISKPHFGAFAPYIFEENPTERRIFLDKNELKIGIFQENN